jgi:hypothetical protein
MFLLPKEEWYTLGNARTSFFTAAQNSSLLRSPDPSLLSVLARLNGQNAAVKSNPQAAVWSGHGSPIEEILHIIQIPDDFKKEGYRERSAQLIEALHCCVPLYYCPGPDTSDLEYAMLSDNLPALKAILRKCKGVFTHSYMPMEHKGTQG